MPSKVEMRGLRTSSVCSHPVVSIDGRGHFHPASTSTLLSLPAGFRGYLELLLDSDLRTWPIILEVDSSCPFIMAQNIKIEPRIKPEGVKLEPGVKKEDGGNDSWLNLPMMPRRYQPVFQGLTCSAFKLLTPPCTETQISSDSKKRKAS